MPEIIDVYEVTGEYDIIATAKANDLHRLRSLCGTVKLVLPPSSYPYEVMHNCYRRCYLLYALQLLRVDVVVENNLFILFLFPKVSWK